MTRKTCILDSLGRDIYWTGQIDHALEVSLSITITTCCYKNIMLLQKNFMFESSFRNARYDILHLIFTLEHLANFSSIFWWRIGILSFYCLKFLRPFRCMTSLKCTLLVLRTKSKYRNIACYGPISDAGKIYASGMNKYQTAYVFLMRSVIHSYTTWASQSIPDQSLWKRGQWIRMQAKQPNCGIRDLLVHLNYPRNLAAVMFRHSLLDLTWIRRRGMTKTSQPKDNMIHQMCIFLASHLWKSRIDSNRFVFVLAVYIVRSLLLRFDACGYRQSGLFAE